MIKVTNLTKIYKSKNKNNCVALDNISFTLPEKGLVFVIGKSGSGKSTLLNMLGGLDYVTSGEVLVLGNKIHNYKESKLHSYRANMVGFIFQDFHLLDELTVEENISISLKLNNKNDLAKVNKVLKEVGLEGYNNRYPSELSGGEKQRVAIARALIKNPDVILADEPTGNLDSTTTTQIIELIKKISKEKLVVIISHNLYDAYDYADRIIELSYGKIISDLELNKNYSNEIKIEDNEVIIPLLRRFNDEELNKLLQLCKNDKVTNIKQDNTKFIKYKEIEYENKKVDIKRSSLPLKESFRFSYLLGKNRIFRFIFSSIMAAMIVVVLALSQSIAYFNSDELISEELTKSNSVLCLRKDMDINKGEENLKYISNNDIEEFKKVDPNVNVYKLYTDTIWYFGSKNVSLLKTPIINYKELYMGETNGTLETTPEYAKKLLNLEQLDIYTGNITYQKYGIYVTDFIADSFIYYGIAENYDEVLGPVYESTRYIWGYVNGIIKTDYKIKYKDVLAKIYNYGSDLEMDDEMLNFYDYVMQALAIGYSFESDYVSEAIKNNYNKTFAWTHNITIDGVEANKVVQYVGPDSFYLPGRNLDINEVYMSYDAYNEIFNTKYNLGNVDEFIPHKAEITISDFYSDIGITIEVEIVEIGANKGCKMLFSDEVFQQLKQIKAFCYGIYLDTTEYNNVINLSMNNNYVNNSIRISAIQTMTKAVSVFNDFFDLIVFILIASVIFIVISFGVKNIKSNMYQIGVLKALGCEFKNFIIIFMLHTIVIAVTTAFISVLGFAFITDIANSILVESLHKLAPNYVILDLEFIRFNITLISIDCIVVILIFLLSTIIPAILLKSIKPISIIKAKE